MFLEVLEGSGNPGRRPRVPASLVNVNYSWCSDKIYLALLLTIVLSC